MTAYTESRTNICIWYEIRICPCA